MQAGNAAGAAFLPPNPGEHLAFYLNVVPELVVAVLQHSHQAPYGGLDACLCVVQLGAEVVPELGDELHEAPGTEVSR
jgi:hypothetical protein